MFRKVLHIVILMFVFACKKENALDCFKSNGPYHEETREFESFKSISVNQLINLKIYKGPKHKVVIKTGKNLIPNIYTKVIDNVLTIENHNECNFVRGYKQEINIDVTTPYVDLLNNLGVGNIVVDKDFEQDTLVARIESSGDIYINGHFNQIRTSTHGNGNMYLNGSANSFYVYTNGMNFVYADQLIVKDYAFIQSISIGDCLVNASQLNLLDYSLQSTGNLYYTGEPKNIHSGGDGQGKAIKK